MSPTKHVFSSDQAETHDFCGKQCWCAPVVVDGGCDELVIHQGGGR